jgi:hypothetical protein
LRGHKDKHKARNKKRQASTKSLTFPVKTKNTASIHSQIKSPKPSLRKNFSANQPMGIDMIIDRGWVEHHIHTIQGTLSEQ